MSIEVPEIMKRYDFVIEKLKEENRLVKDFADGNERTIDARSYYDNAGEFKSFIMEIIYEDKTIENRVLFSSIMELESFELTGKVLIY